MQKRGFTNQGIIRFKKGRKDLARARRLGDTSRKEGATTKTPGGPNKRGGGSGRFGNSQYNWVWLQGGRTRSAWSPVDALASLGKGCGPLERNERTFSTQGENGGKTKGKGGNTGKKRLEALKERKEGKHHFGILEKERSGSHGFRSTRRGGEGLMRGRVARGDNQPKRRLPS